MDKNVNPCDLAAVNPLVSTAAGHIRRILTNSIKRAPEARVLVVFDRQSGLASIVADGYREALPDAQFINFDEMEPAAILAEIDKLSPGDVVALVQTTSFRLNEFRLRLELFKRGLKTVEHVHLGRMPEGEWATWINALSFDPDTDGNRARALKAILDKAQRIDVFCDGLNLTWDTGMEPAKLNIGDYTGMENVGGTYPIGEVFTEAQDLTKVNGELKIYAFADADFLVRFYEPPFTAIVRDGLIEAGSDAPESFKAVMEKIKADERPLVREFGLGLNRAISRQKPVIDITAFERVNGLHLSLGEKHGVYKKPGFVPHHTKYHVDVFPAVDKINVDGQVIFDNGDFLA